jgi:hypothetical protein
MVWNTPRVDDTSPGTLLSKLSQKEERLAEMEDALHTQAKLTDGCRVRDLVARSVESDSALVLGLEDSVVDDKEPTPLKQWVGGIGDTWRDTKNHMTGLSVVRVLDEFLQNRKSLFIAIPEIVAQSRDGLERVLYESGNLRHVLSPVRSISRSGTRPSP